MAEKKSKPAAKLRRPSRRRADMSPLEFLKSVYRAPIPKDADPATRARFIANKLAAAKAAAAYELQQRQQPEAGEGELAALLREIEGEADDDR